jgi:hypothetical protein
MFEKDMIVLFAHNHICKKRGKNISVTDTVSICKTQTLPVCKKINGTRKSVSKNRITRQWLSYEAWRASRVKQQIMNKIVLCKDCIFVPKLV